MGKSQETYNKKEKEKKKLKKRQEKEARKLARKEEEKNSSLDSMMAYVDEFGNITDTPPDPTKKKKEIKAENIVIGVPTREAEPEMDPIRKGVVEFFNSEKGFGFIKDNENEEKYFVHVSSLSEEIVENDKVQYELEQGMKGLNAVRVVKL
ncbi:MAG: cold-shock protein [Flavobacteriales bacterium]